MLNIHVSDVFGNEVIFLADTVAVIDGIVIFDADNTGEYPFDPGDVVSVYSPTGLPLRQYVIQ